MNALVRDTRPTAPSRDVAEAVHALQKQYVEWLLGSPLPQHVRLSLRSFYETELTGLNPRSEKRT